LVAMAAVLAGCKRQGERGAAPAPGASAEPPLYLNHAQPRLPTVKLWLGAHELTAEVARTTTEIATGMMFRTNMAETEGMLFVFGGPFQVAFYMRNTQVPLSCAYMDPAGTILEIHDLEPFNEKAVEARSDNVQYVLETARGWFARHQVTPGTVVRTSVASFDGMNWAALRPWSGR